MPLNMTRQAFSAADPVVALPELMKDRVPCNQLASHLVGKLTHNRRRKTST